MSCKTYFLGGNTTEGFFSCYDSFCRPEDGAFLWVIKGGPGCGKSSFMRKIGNAAEEQGLNVEYVLCSGDPDSLDGVYIPALKLGYVDGTAPHVIDPQFPAVSGAYLDLGQFYDIDALQTKAAAIKEINREYKACYNTAYKLLSEHIRDTETNDHACKRRCFLSAISCKGIISLPSTPISEPELQSLLKEASESDTAVLHPLFPKGVIGIVKDSVSYARPLEMPDCSNVVAQLRRAKELHDELEHLYNPHVDFDNVYKLAKTHIQKYL